MSNPFPANSSLVRYNNPTLVNTTKDKNGKSKKPAKPISSDRKQLSQTEDLLNSILPPREWSDKNQLWVQYVSSTPATRLDVINLQEQLDHKLQQRQARETGICPVREELYAQCFDELIRQITINCAERGLLLLRLRDEYRMTVAAFQTLYESSIAFGMRKALLAEQRKIDIKNRINELQNKSSVLDRQIEELTEKCDQVEQEEEAKVEDEEKQHQEQVAFLKESNEQLKKNLEALLSAPKK